VVRILIPLPKPVARLTGESLLIALFLNHNLIVDVVYNVVQEFCERYSAGFLAQASHTVPLRCVPARNQYVSFSII